MPSLMENMWTISQKNEPLAQTKDLQKETIIVNKKKTLKALINKGAIKMKKADEIFKDQASIA